MAWVRALHWRGPAVLSYVFILVAFTVAISMVHQQQGQTNDTVLKIEREALTRATTGCNQQNDFRTTVRDLLTYSVASSTPQTIDESQRLDRYRQYLDFALTRIAPLDCRPVEHGMPAKVLGPRDQPVPATIPVKPTKGDKR